MNPFMGAWPRVRRWRLNPSLRRGRLKSRGEVCHLRDDLSPCGSTELGAGPGRCRAPVAAPESVAGRTRGGDRRPVSVAGAVASSCVMGRRGTKVDGPRTAGDPGRVSPLL
ncbi:hypothetical protein NDU88_003677 [Pleurodeles waltl]|uniref:Uncharacterized protein n=1 Tax=Pleurodeles waltl TaxID=8319 RepID=A0AAV7UZ39_PLEWA|nr:hypothetical protein NDU88_003677 [Pleurodeles waltl]